MDTLEAEIFPDKIDGRVGLVGILLDLTIYESDKYSENYVHGSGNKLHTIMRPFSPAACRH